MLREAHENDLHELLQLYLHLHEDSVPDDSEKLRSVWQRIMSDSDHHIIVNVQNGKIVYFSNNPVIQS